MRSESELGADAIWFCAISNCAKCFIGRREEEAGDGGEDSGRESAEDRRGPEETGECLLDSFYSQAKILRLISC